MGMLRIIVSVKGRAIDFPYNPVVSDLFADKAISIHRNAPHLSNSSAHYSRSLAQLGTTTYFGDNSRSHQGKIAIQPFLSCGKPDILQKSYSHSKIFKNRLFARCSSPS